MTAITLYDAPRCPFCARTRIVLAEKGVPYDTVTIDLADRPSTDSREVTPGIVLDFDATGALVGIDIDGASRQLDVSGLRKGSVPVELVRRRSGERGLP